ncbi:GAF and ANTAR domain-containing protein [Amycolatopsis mongoliensis]|uniref:GAF and ANTAR domain-containing protein n=1 Tax=Amycolatopsis mongoliensis TaxID=715475 RepID=A0A9Y2JK58_9PSEU|nr:GAF and ANTAR domain-containing protein [Amycolatopsis sp. 4-36]WIX98338.1 GAF and ANTAR domain-containing protein [Amycolatopsis sp. 4-36]
MDGQRRDRLWRLVTSRADGQHRFSGWAGAVCDAALAEVDVDAAAITVHPRPQRPELVAATGRWAERLEEAQYTVGEGPGAEAFGTGGPVLVADVTRETARWPGFADAAAEAGVTAVFAFPLQVGAVRLGTLTLYRRTPGELSPDELANLAVLAELAVTAALTDSIIGTDMWAGEASAGHYDDVHVAAGMLAARLNISIDDAYLRLRAHSFSHHQSLIEVAREVLARRLRLDSAD